MQMARARGRRAAGEWFSDEARAALAAVGAAAGTGLASGRELVLFFGQLGWAAWIGIPVASALYALMLGAVCHRARRGGAATLPGLYWRQLSPAAGVVAGAMYALLMLLVAAAMLAGAGEIGALTLPLNHGFLWGAAMALLFALMINLAHLRPLPWLGLSAAALGLMFYAGLALDPRPVRVYLKGETELALRGNVGAALQLAALYAAFNAATAGGAVVRLSGGGIRPRRFAALAGATLCAMLLCGEATLMRGGDALLGQALPTVLLAARWGAAGFWLCCGFGFLCAVMTLSAALSGLSGLRFRGC